MISPLTKESFSIRIGFFLLCFFNFLFLPQILGICLENSQLWWLESSLHFLPKCEMLLFLSASSYSFTWMFASLNTFTHISHIPFLLFGCPGKMSKTFHSASWVVALQSANCCSHSSPQLFKFRQIFLNLSDKDHAQNIKQGHKPIQSGHCMAWLSSYYI